MERMHGNESRMRVVIDNTDGGCGTRRDRAVVIVGATVMVTVI